MTKEYPYRREEDFSLKLYTVGSQTNVYGRLCNIDLDRVIYAYNRDDGRFPVKVTSKLDVQIFEKPDFANYLGVFTSDRIATSFYNAMVSVLRDTQELVTLPFFETYFLLKEKEKELRQYFDNMTEISVAGVRDSYIQRAKLKGHYLADSEEYQKLVKDKDVGGNVEFFGVSVEDRLIILVSDGVIYTRQGSDRNESLRHVLQIVTNIKKADALRSKSAILEI